MNSLYLGLKKLQVFVISICMLLVYMPFQVQAAANAELKPGDTYSGFRLEKQANIKDIDSDMLVFNHFKSGAHLVWLKNNDNNKGFSINFRTPAYDDTGVNHIIEHCVLEGSEHYPVKSLFYQLAKKSLNNFLNGLTFPDMTSFPFSTTNDKDFENLMDIYLDGVFHPNVLKDPRIFEQEGWHYELNSKDSALRYNGVVYNEDNGYSSSPDETLNSLINKSLFPDTSYKYWFAGIPEAIPQLTYEKFVSTYKKHYKPSNSYIYLYGDIDINKTLKIIDEKYLSKFNKEKVDTAISIQKPFTKPSALSDFYSVPAGSDTKKQSYISLNYCLGDITNMKDINTLMIIDRILLGKATSPLRAAARQAGIGNIDSQFSMQQFQPVYTIAISDTDEDKKATLQKLVSNCFNSLIKNGIDQKTLDGIVTSYEISTREKNISSDRSIFYNNQIMGAWLYDKDPSLLLNSSDMSENIKNGITKDCLKKLINKYILNNKFSSVAILKPKPGYEETLTAKLKKKLSDYKASLSPAQVSNLVKQTEALRKWQDEPNSKEALATIPSLSISDINPKVQTTPCETQDYDGIKILTHPMYTNDIAYLKMYFDTSKVPQDKVPYLALLSSLLRYVDTTKYKAADFSNELTKSGHAYFQATEFSKADDTKTYYPKLMFSATTLKEKVPKLLDLIGEWINNAKFNNTSCIGNMIKSLKEEQEGYLQEDSSYLALNRDLSYFSPASKYDTCIYGLDYINFLKNLDASFAKNPKEICKNLDEVAKLVFNKSNLIVSITSNKANCEELVNNVKAFSKTLNTTDAKGQMPYNFDNKVKNEAFKIPAKIQYIAQGYDFRSLGYKAEGSLAVLNNILTNDYLIPQLRVKGGAYGAECYGSYNGSFTLSSSEDPNLKETLKVFKGAADFLKNFQVDTQTMNDYIIGAIAGIDKPESPSGLSYSSDADYISGYTNEDAQKWRTELLNTTAETIRKYAEMIDKIIKQNYICAAGNSTKIDENKDVFDSIKEILVEK